jgi:hypothetical protein
MRGHRQGVNADKGGRTAVSHQFVSIPFRPAMTESAVAVEKDLRDIAIGHKAP